VPARPHRQASGAASLQQFVLLLTGIGTGPAGASSWATGPPGVADLRLTRKMYPFKYPFPPSEVVEFFRSYYGPTNRAFAALAPDRQAALRSDLERLWSEHNQASDGGTELKGEYLEVAAIRA